eukprot:GFUD01062682.1.p1 GENE.GFUD01062682.1~~GFUD01062682.1.p1  ORF type:complete len:176 (-),score=39.23 GFUD01062682.1:93-620(-)
MFQAGYAHSDPLCNPNKLRVKGPSGRRPPSKKKPNEKEALTNGENESKAPLSISTIFSGITRNSKVSKSKEDDSISELVNSDAKNSNGKRHTLGRIDAADFDKVWFFRVPTLSHQKRKKPEESCSIIIGENNNTKTVRNTSTKTNDDTVISVGAGDIAESKERRRRRPWKMCQLL